jgi:D-proline reductase (dithiol) PrdB
MARLSDLDESSRVRLLNLECPVFDSRPWVAGPPLSGRRVAVVSTAGLHARSDKPFGLGANGYRIIPGDLPAGEIVMSHVSANFDRTGFQQDLNVVFPLERLRELAAEGVIGSVAGFHYSFMGATAPEQMEPVARGLARVLARDRVDAVLLVPV